MIENLDNFENVLSNIFFVGFKVIVIILTTLLILSLIILAIGCWIKSQKIKSKFLIVTPSLLICLALFLALPYFLVQFKNMM